MAQPAKETASRPLVGVVIVNFNLKDSLRETLRSFQEINYPHLQIVVSDNASADGSQAMVRQEFPHVHLLAHATQQGYARAASLGMRFLLERQCRYIFSTTNDVIVDREMLNRLVDFAEQTPAAGVIGTKIFFFDRPTHLWHAGGSMNPLHVHSRHFGWNRPDHPRYNRIRDCDYVTGCGFLLRAEALQKVGCFREEFIFYSEDAELCYRIRAAGYRVIYLPTAHMWHKVDTTLSKDRPTQLRYSTRNNLYLIQQHRAGWYPLSLWIHLLVVSPVKMLIFALLGRGPNSVGIWRGIRDWQAGRLGWIK